jgi:hypothetical protein
MSKGYVYILANEFMPGLVKIGKTTRAVESRANELYQTGVPSPFNVMCYVVSPDCGELEAWVHEALADCRVNEGREFFYVAVEHAERTLKDLLREQVEAWLEEFIPGQVLVDEYAFVDPAELFTAADALGVAIYEVAGAVSEIAPDELAPALHGYMAKKSRHLRVVSE